MSAMSDPRARADARGMTAAPWVEVLAAILRGVPSLPGAACAGHPEPFDPPERGDDPHDTAERHAFAVSACQRCPALPACRAWFASLRPTQRPHGVTAGQVHNPRPVGRPTREAAP